MRYAHDHLNRIKAGPAGKRPGSTLAMLSWWSFLIALITGAVLAFHFRPWGDVFKEVSRLTGHLPYGSFLRTLHYLSGQSFLIFTLAHGLDAFWKTGRSAFDIRKWVGLISVMVLAFLLMLTGFILKGDQEGILAATVMYSLAREVPFIGPFIAAFFLKPGEDFFLLPYLHHTVIIPFMVLFLVGHHRRRLLPKGALGWTFLAVLSLLALIVPLPPDIPPHMASVAPTGPWFFQGVQLLLRYCHPFWAGVMWPLLPLVLMAALPIIPRSRVRWLRVTTTVVWCIHGGLILVAWRLLPGIGR